MDEKNESQKEKLQRVEEAFKYETSEELKRKREVYLSHIVAETQEEIGKSRKDVEFNQKAYDALSKIIRKRERSRLRRELLKEALQWTGLLGPLVVGVIIGLASHSLKEFLANVAKLIIH
jgi:hypothetical protein